MEWKSNLRRTQSLRSVPSSCDKPSWTEAGLRDKITSVSQLVARYQTTVEISSSIHEISEHNGEVKPKLLFNEITASPLETRQTHLESLTRRNDVKERTRDQTSLTRSKSVGSLHSSAGSIGALKALFESKTDTQNTVRSSVRATSFKSPNKSADVPPMVNGEREEMKSSAEEPKIQNPPDAPVNDAKTDHVTQKVVNQTRTERRKTIGGIDFETITASQADEKRRSIADFRDSSFIQTKEKLCVSVKAISALYLSKVAPQDSSRSLLKPAQDQSSESGRRTKPTKMAQQRKDDLSAPPSAGHQRGPEDTSQSMASQLSIEKLHQQRQKCELRRLLRHTHPELKMLDEVVDEELAEVLSSDTGGTAAETGYEGEVLSRRLIFENCAKSTKVSPYTPKMHKVEGTAGRGDVCKTSTVFEEHEGRPCHGSDKVDDQTLGSGPDPNRECEEEEMMRVDVQATRRIFESQSANTSIPNPDNKFQGKVSIYGDETGAVQKRKQELVNKNLHSEDKSNACTKSLDLSGEPEKQGPCVHHQEFPGRDEVSTGDTVFEDAPTSLQDPEEFGETIKTSAALFQNNPFIPTNIERELSVVHKPQSAAGDSEAAQDYLSANVRNRAHLFESMPFDQIRHQNKDEIETMVENIKETLDSLYRVNAVHSDGSIIEVNETMIAKKAKFILSETGPKIKYDEVAEGGAQNLILQLLPRANLKPQIIYLKEGSKGNMEATVVNVPLHQHHFTTQPDAEFKTANVVQVVEDILNQDNSLRKGVVIQEDADRCAEVIVYALYYYFDEEDVKTYYPPQGAEYDEPEPERGDLSKRDDQELRKGIIESTISCLLETPKDQPCPGSMRPEITVKGNVKLFKSCIEKGDLEYLKTLQAEPTVQEQELPPDQNAVGQGLDREQRVDEAEESPEWVPVDVKKLKHMFSGDQRPPKPKHVWENLAPSTPIPCALTGQLGKSQSPPESIQGQIKSSCRECGGKNSTVAPQGPYLHFETQDAGWVHQAELVEVVDDSDEISDLQTAIQSLQQATVESKSSQENLLEQPVVLDTAGNVKHTEAELSQEKEDPCTTRDKLPSTSNITSEHKSEHESTEGCCKDTDSTVQTTVQKDTEVDQKQHVQAAPVSAQSPEATTTQQEDEEVVFEGKLQAALDSLERSNINVKRGDYRAAMIYRNASKANKKTSQNVDALSAQKQIKEEFFPVTEVTLTQVVSKEQAATAKPPSQSEAPHEPATSAASEQIRRPVGPKPAIPPKPEHLKVKQSDIQSVNTMNPEASQENSVRPEDMVPQPLAMTAMSTKDQVQSSVITLEGDITDKNILKQQQEINTTAGKEQRQDVPVEENMNETDESHVDFHEACKKFGGKNAPAKPKRVKIAQPDIKNLKHMSGDHSETLTHVVEEQHQTASRNNPNTCGRNADKRKKETKQASKVEMREKKGRTETEDERRQRLSVHMDEIMRGNTTAAMEIFDNLRKQEELKSILSRVEEIEQDTSEVDVRSLRGVFESVPDWVVSSGRKKQKKAKAGNKEERTPLTRDSTESKSPMSHVFGDLERASEEIMNLKEQTLARLVDIEEAIKKALYSVSTLKSDSDIAGLSCLFKESLRADQGSISSGNISKISIESSRTKSLQRHKAVPVNQSARPEVAPAKQRASPPSSPAFISIQSAARKTSKPEALPPEATICPTCQHNPRTEEKFRTTKTLTCNSPAQNRKRDPRKGGNKQSSHNPKRELSVLEVQTDGEGNMGTKTVTENYEKTDQFGNRFYSSRTSTVVTGQPEPPSPATYQITKYPEVQLPVNQKP